MNDNDAQPSGPDTTRTVAFPPGGVASETRENVAAILNALPAHVALVDGSGVIVAVNEGWRRFARANALQGSDFGVGQSYIALCEAVQGEHAEEARMIAPRLRAILSGEESEFTLDYPCHAPSEKRWFRMLVTPLGEGRPQGAVITHFDITGRKLAEERLARINRLYLVLSRVNEEIARARDQHELFEKACRIAVEQGLFRMAAVVLLDERTGEVGAQVHAGAEDGYFKEISLSASDPTLSIGPIGTAIRTQAFDICNDTASDPRMAVWREPLRRHGFGSIASFPLTIAGRPIGAFTLYASEPDCFQKDEVELLTAVQKDLAFAAESLQKERQRQQAEAALRASEASMAAAQGIAHFGSWEQDLADPGDASAMRWSDEMFRIAGLEPRSLRVTRDFFFQLVHPEDREPVREAVAAAIRGRKPYSIVHRLIKAGGEERVIHESAEIFFDEKTWQPLRMVGTAHDITDQRRAEAERDRLFNLSLDLLCVAGFDGRLRQVNPAWTTCLGWSAEDLTGRPMSEFIHPEDLEATTQVRNRIHEGQPLRGFENRYRCRDGSFRWLAWSVFPLLDSRQVFGVARDVTERKRDADALAQSERRYRAIFEHAVEGIFQSTPEGRYVTVNPAFARILGYESPEELVTMCRDIGRQVYANPQDRERFKALLAEHGVVNRFEHEAVRKDGSTVWVSLNGRAIRNPDGALAFLEGSIEDITARKMAEEQRDRLFELSPDLLCVGNFEGRLEQVNPAWTRSLGWSTEELTSRPWMEFIHPDDLPHVRLMEEKLGLGQTVREFESRFRCRDGSHRWLSWSVHPLPQSRQAFAVARDITERKRQETQFLRAQRMESIGTLAGGIAHDLNNVLAPIMMSIELLKSNLPEEERGNLLHTLQANAQRGADLIKQVLSFARGVEGQRVNVNPVHILRELLKVLRETFPKNITVELADPGDTWTVVGDATQLHQVFMNLLVNARDAMPMGGQITISLANAVLDETYAAMNPDSHPGSYLLVKVVDTGAGIPAAIQERIFEPFFTTKEFGKGTGLGLSTTLAIVKSHGGFINLYSEMGRGTQFKVYLPANSTREVAERVEVEQTRLPRGHGEMILVVDDEEAIRKVAQGTLERFGYQVLLASNGAEAVSAYAQQREKISVVLTDMAMPIMDGPALIVALKVINPRVRIVASSGLASNGGVAKAIDAGVHHFVPKPYTAEAMLKTLDEVLRAVV